jgi:hypothetical protein
MVAFGVRIHDHSEALSSLVGHGGVTVFAVFALAELGAFYTGLEALTIFLLASRFLAVAAFDMSNASFINGFGLNIQKNF